MTPLDLFFEISLFSNFTPKKTTNLQKHFTKDKTKNIVDYRSREGNSII
jgi:hypothetical protein